MVSVSSPESSSSSQESARDCDWGFAKEEEDLEGVGWIFRFLRLVWRSGVG